MKASLCREKNWRIGRQGGIWSGCAAYGNFTQRATTAAVMHYPGHTDFQLFDVEHCRYSVHGHYNFDCHFCDALQLVSLGTTSSYAIETIEVDGVEIDVFASRGLIHCGTLLSLAVKNKMVNFHGKYQGSTTTTTTPKYTTTRGDHFDYGMIRVRGELL